MAPSKSETYDHPDLMNGSYLNEDYQMITPSIEPFNEEHYPTFPLGDEMDTSTTENTPSLTHQRSPGKSIESLEESLFESFPETHTWEEHLAQFRHDASLPTDTDINPAYIDPKLMDPSFPLTPTDVTNQYPPVEPAAHSPAGPVHSTQHPIAPTGPLCCPECQTSFRRPTEYNKDRKKHAKLLRCDSCGHRNHSNKDFRRHLASCQPAAYGTPRVRCDHPGCGSTFARKDGMQKHQQNFHSAPKRTRRRRPLAL